MTSDDSADSSMGGAKTASGMIFNKPDYAALVEENKKLHQKLKRCIRWIEDMMGPERTVRIIETGSANGEP